VVHLLDSPLFGSAVCRCLLPFVASAEAVEHPSTAEGDPSSPPVLFHHSYKSRAVAQGHLLHIPGACARQMSQMSREWPPHRREASETASFSVDMPLLRAVLHRTIHAHSIFDPTGVTLSAFRSLSTGCRSVVSHPSDELRSIRVESFRRHNIECAPKRTSGSAMKQPTYYYLPPSEFPVP
jgi:hypothetical protein